MEVSSLSNLSGSPGSRTGHELEENGAKGECVDCSCWEVISEDFRGDVSMETFGDSGTFVVKGLVVPGAGEAESSELSDF